MNLTPREKDKLLIAMAAEVARAQLVSADEVASALSRVVCPICGTAKTAAVCAVDGHRFEAAK